MSLYVVLSRLLDLETLFIPDDKVFSPLVFCSLLSYHPAFYLFIFSLTIRGEGREIDDLWCWLRLLSAFSSVV